MTALAKVLEDGCGRRRSTFDGYALDLDGTVYLDDRLLPGAAEPIGGCPRPGSRRRLRHQQAARAGRGVCGQADGARHPGRAAADIVTALDSLVRYLAARASGRSAADHRRATRRHGLRATRASRRGRSGGRPRSSSCRSTAGFSYAKLLAAYRAVRRGAVIVATNPDPFCPTADGGLPDCAAMLAALEACTGRRAEVVTGKPSRHMGATLVDRSGSPPERAADGR